MVAAKLIYTYPMAMTCLLYLYTVIHQCLRPWLSRSMFITMSMPMCMRTSVTEAESDAMWFTCTCFPFFVVVSPFSVNWCMPCPLHVVCVFCSVPIHLHSFFFSQLLHLHPLRVRSQCDKMADRLHSQNNFMCRRLADSAVWLQQQPNSTDLGCCWSQTFFADVTTAASTME